jgi:photosystem II PsbT protein
MIKKLNSWVMNSAFSASWLVNLKKIESLGNTDMESVAYILILTLALGVLFFAIAFREPPRIGK